MRNIASSTLFLTGSTIVFVASGYVINIWLGRNLGPESYGIYGIIISLLTTINLFLTSGFPHAMAKFISSNTDKIDEIFKTTFFLQAITIVLISILYYLSAPYVAHYLQDDGLIPYLRFSSLVFPVYGMYALYYGYYNGVHNFKKQSIMSIIYSITRLVSIIILTSFFHLFGSIFSFIIAPLIAIFFGFLRVPKTARYFPNKKLLFFAIPLIAFAFVSMLLSSADLYFVKALLSSNELVGFYTMNQNLARIPFYILGALPVILFPSISKSVSEKNTERTAVLIQDSIRYTLIFLIPASLAISATSLKLIQLLFSDAYLPASPSLAILVISFIFITIFTVFSNILIGSGYPYLTLGISLIGILITALSCYFLIPKYQLVGAALATGIGGFVCMVLSGIFVYKKFGVLSPVASTLKIITASILLYFIAASISLPAYFLPIVYLISGSAYLLTLLITKEITKKDMELAISILPQNIKDVLIAKKNS